MSSLKNIVRCGNLLLRNPKGIIPDTDGMVRLTISTLGGMTYDEFKSTIKGIDVSKLVTLQYDAGKLAAINTSKLKSISITGAEATGDIESLKMKFKTAGVESCNIAIMTDILI